MTALAPTTSLAIAATAAVICTILILALRPLLQRYALTRPNARSSHVTPTPQGGGLAVIAATAIGAALTVLSGSTASGTSVLIVLAAGFCLAAVGMVDDVRPIPVIPRLTLQLAVVVVLFTALPPQIRFFETIPVAIERAFIVLGMLWFINLVNFMDGLDWMTVAEMVPMTVALGAIALLGEAPANILPIALGLAGALLGFAPFNRPVAKLFLGDVGSLPIGLLTGWCLLELASRQHLAAAILLPLYYLSDATITLFRRLVKGERFWDAHRSHFYQRATDNGFSVTQVIARVFLLNLALAGLAMTTIAASSRSIDLTMLALGACVVTAVLFQFSQARVAQTDQR
ncbi:glycosyltransferase family 4 protein [Bradyrhizobium sp. OAE829]|uniref:MraY family glycosyltransferase n=1 Tax=Bradyrhizobium sp. OAE829 TaxID=2663807 RepID=UPI00178BA800